MAYGARLESVLGASPRGFESPILRRNEGPALARSGARVVAVDFSPGMIAQGKRRHKKIEFVEADAKFWSMRGLYYRQVEDGVQSSTTHNILTVEQMARLRQVTTHLHTVGTEVTMFASLWGGTATFRNPSFLGRALRDTSVARNHALIDVVTLDNAATPIIESWRRK